MGNSERVIVVGAGIAGLAAAWRLQQQGFDVVVLEAAETVGGRMATVEKNGYKFDTGAIVLSRRYPQMQALIQELGMDAQVSAASSAIGVPHNGSFHTIYVDSVAKNLTTGLISWKDKAKSLGLIRQLLQHKPAMDWFDLSAALSSDTESGYDFLTRHGPEELRDRLIAPMFRGLYLENIEDMSVIDFLFIFSNYFGGGLFSFREGIAALPRMLAERLDVRCNTCVVEVSETASGVRVACHHPEQGDHVENADACVIALTAQQMAAVFPQLPSELADVARDTYYSRILNVQLALDKAPDSRAVALMLPVQDYPEICSIYLDHNKNPFQVPRGKGLATVFWNNLKGLQMWDLDDEEIISRTAMAAARVLPGLDYQVRFGMVTRCEPGILVPAPGAYAALAPLARWRTTANRVQIAGDYFTGGSTNSALCSGERAARLVMKRFFGRH
jgi:protoporphyrinogen/coproporphyrinogen III oxidase